MNPSTKEKIATAFKERMDHDELESCMRCGFCLPVCPTYIQSGYDETQSPRGRIALMKGIVNGEIEPDEDIEQTLNECLGCLACEPACPAGVNYGALLEEARDIFNEYKKHPFLVKMLRKVVFDDLFPNPNRIEKLTSLLGLYQRTGLQKIVQKTGMTKVLPDTLSTMEKVLPKVPTKKEMQSDQFYNPSTEKVTARVAFFKGCLMDTMFKETNKSTIKLLQEIGCEIVVPNTQNCCGALHGHSGEKEKAKNLAKENIIAFEEERIDYIITNAGGCGAFLHEYDHLLKDEPEWAERAKIFASKIKDITSILVELKLHEMDLSLPNQVVTYQDSCHLRNVQHVSVEPRQLLQSIEGVKYEEMHDAERCCGSAGIYNITQSELSMEHLNYKMEQVNRTNATTIVTTNPGCLLQMKLGIEREGLSDKMRAVHIVDLLREAIKNE